MTMLIPNRILLLPLILLFATACQAQQVGEVVRLDGQAHVTHASGETVALAAGDPVFVQDTLQTAEQSVLVIRMVDQSRLTLGENTRVEVSRYRTSGEPEALITITRGRLGAFVSDFFSSRSESFKVKTTRALAGVRGTELIVIADPEQTRMIVMKGEGVVYSSDPAIVDRIILRDRQSTIIREGHSPTPPTAVDTSLLKEIGLSGEEGSQK